MDYFSRSPVGNHDGGASPAIPPTPDQASARAGYPSTSTATSAGTPRSRPAIRIRRPPSNNALQRTISQQTDGDNRQLPTVGEEQATSGGRRRSSSEPQRPSQQAYELARQPTAPSAAPQGEQLATVTEEKSTEEHAAPSGTPRLQVPGQAFEPLQPSRTAPPVSTDNLARRPGVMARVSTAAMQMFPRRQDNANANGDNQAQQEQNNHYDQDVVDLLDVIDPEVSTLTTLNNYQNSFFLPPPVGRYFSRAPAYDLSLAPTATTNREAMDDFEKDDAALQRKATIREEEATEAEEGEPERLAGLTRLTSTLSSVSEGPDKPYAVLPHGVSLEGWKEEEKEELNDHVRHLLHSRKAKFRRKMKGFGKYVRTPLGFFVTTYSFLITFWGAAWVLFLIGWLHAGNRQAYFIEICDQVLTALFTVVGLGLAPFRAVDTYHMIYIAHYHHLTWSLRKEKDLPKLKDQNQLPGQPTAEQAGADVEDEAGKPGEESVLSPEQQRKFLHHQKKFSRSHTFYKSHETYTHRAFPLDLLVAVVCLFDCHSLFQMALGGTTWGIYYRHRPKALTAVILAFSISCNIAGGITISVGDKRTRKRLIVEQLFRQSLTQEAMKRMGKREAADAKDAAAKKRRSKESRRRAERREKRLSDKQIAEKLAATERQSAEQQEGRRSGMYEGT